MVRQDDPTDTPGSTSDSPPDSTSHVHNGPLDTPELDTTPESSGRDTVAIDAAIEVTNEGPDNIVADPNNALIDREGALVPTVTTHPSRTSSKRKKTNFVKKRIASKKQKRRARLAAIVALNNNDIFDEDAELALDQLLQQQLREQLQQPEQHEELPEQLPQPTPDDITSINDMPPSTDPPLLNPSSTAESSNRSAVSNLIDELNLLSSSTQHIFIEGSPKKYQPLDYEPRRALAHQFHNMDHQSLILYGDNDLQVWDLAGDNVVSEWKGTADNIRIEQAAPLSSSVLALVTKANQLSFLGIKNARHNRLDEMITMEWVDDAANKNISIVESADWDFDDEFLATLFTGAKSGGGVFRRSFNLVENTVESYDDERMDTRHHGVVSALCHIKAKEQIISGSTFGNICINNHQNGKCLQEFDLGEESPVCSITACPSNPNLIMVGCCQPRSEMLIFDSRQKLNKSSYSLRLRDESCTILSHYSRSAWITRNNMILVPGCQIVDNSETATILTWDPRFSRCGAAQHIALGQNKRNAYSADIFKPAAGNGQAIVATCEDALVTVPFDFESVSN